MGLVFTKKIKKEPLFNYTLYFDLIIFLKLISFYTSILARKSISSTGGGQDEMQEELKHVLTLFRDKRRTLDIIKTPEIFIQQSSSADEVEQWLKAKGFSDKVVKKLHGLNGNELFALKRPTLEDYCGSEEGKRLASQITIQRNVSGVIKIH